MIDTTSRIRQAAGEFLLLTVLALVPPVLIYIDVSILENGVREACVTEIVQEALLLMMALLLGYGAWKHPSVRGFLVLMAAFFGCAFIRELDRLFDMIWKGFWIWPVWVLSVTAITYALISCRDTVIKPMSDFIGTRSYFHLMHGLVMILVFSRVFGSGNLFWAGVMGDDYNIVFKSAMQEGLELYGYLSVFYGVWVYRIRGYDLN